MARSYKKNPVVGNACATSEKKDKQLAHRAQRAHFRTEIQSATDVENFLFEERNEAHSNIFAHAKDGKHHVDLRVAHVGRATRVLSSVPAYKDAREARKLMGK